MTAYEEFGILPEISRALSNMYSRCGGLPTPLHAEAIPLILGGSDVLIAVPQAQTRTAAICVPLVQLVWESLRDILSLRGRNITWTLPWTISYIDRDSALSVSPDKLGARSCIQEVQGARSTRGATSGKWAFEVNMVTEGNCKIGWSNLNSSLDLATDKWGWAYSSTGNKIHDQKSEAYGEKYRAGDIITCLLDLENAQMVFLKNGVDLGIAFENIETSEALFPAVALENCEISLNFGATSFKFPVPVNFWPQIAAPIDKQEINTNELKAKPRPPVRLNMRAPQAIIIETSREEAKKTRNHIKLFREHLKPPFITVMLLLDDKLLKDQINAFRNQGPDIIIAHPTRLLEFISTGLLLLQQCKFFVLSDADELVKQGHMGSIEKLHGMMHQVTEDGNRLQMIVFNTSLYSSEARNIREKLMKSPLCVEMKGEPIVLPNVHQVVVKVDPEQDRSWFDSRRHILTDGVHPHDIKWSQSDTADSLSEAVKMLKGDYVVRAINENNIERAIIFCRTILDCDNLEKFFIGCDTHRYSCVCVHGGRGPNERNAHVTVFRQNLVSFLICTDVAAKELDFTGLPFIINFTLPQEKSLYLDRIGRAGTTDHMGLAISLVSTVPEKVWDHRPDCLSHNTKGHQCRNTNLHDNNGCCIWYDEQQCLTDIEEHLCTSIPEVNTDIIVPYKEVEGKIIYEQAECSSCPSVPTYAKEALASAEREAQIMFLKSFFPNASY